MPSRILCFFARCLGVFFLSFNLHAAVSVELQVNGVSGEIRDNVLIYLSLQQQKDSKQLTPHLIKRLFAKSEAEIRLALQPFGYYLPKIQSALTQPENEDGDGVWQAKFDIDIGDPLKLSDIDIQLLGAGKSDPELVALLVTMPLEAGSRLRHAPYEQLKQNLLTLSSERGYFNADFVRKEIIIDETAYTSQLYLIFDTGPRSCFNSIEFDQLYFKEEFLQKFLTFQPGEAYSSDALLRFRNNLSNSDYFEDIEITTEDAENNCLDIEAHITPRKPNKYLIRIGYGTDTGVRLGGEWTRRYLNSSGHRLVSQIEAAEKKSRIVANVEYIIPKGLIDRDYLSVFARFKGENITSEDLGLTGEGGSTQIQDGSIGLRRFHFRDLFGLHLREEFSLIYLQESYGLLELLFPDAKRTEITDLLINSGRGDYIDVLEPNFRVIYPEISWTYLSADNPGYANNGYQINLALRAGSDKLGSNLNFAQIELGAKWIRRVSEKGRLLVRANTAYTDAKTIDTFGLEASILPRDLQFRTGGDRTVRGYEFQELKGPNSLVSGKHYFVGSVEYEHEIITDWSLATFFDIGNAFNDYNNMSLQRGIGVGVRWKSPVGLVRADFAWGLDKEKAADAWQIHLIVGPDFYLF